MSDEMLQNYIIRVQYPKNSRTSMATGTDSDRSGSRSLHTSEDIHSSVNADRSRSPVSGSPEDSPIAESSKALLPQQRKKKRNVVVQFLRDFYRSEPKEYRFTKMLFGYPFGALLGYGLYSMIIKPMELADETRQLLGGMMILGISCGYATFVGVRCVCILLIPTFFGKAGRSYIGTFAIAYLIAGPMANMMDNAQDITRSLTCAAALAANHTAAKWQLRLKPIGNVLNDMKDDGYMLNKIGKKVNREFSPVKKEVRSGDNVDTMQKKYDSGGDTRNETEMDEIANRRDRGSPAQVERRYKNIVKGRCNAIYRRGMQKCRQTFDGIYHRCLDKLPGLIDKWICPVVRFHWVCDIARVIGKAIGIECNPDEFLSPGMGKTYKDTADSVDQMDSNMKISLRYKVVKQKEDIDYSTIEMMRSNAMHDFKSGRKWVEFIMLIVKRLLGFTFILVVLGAYKYYKSYVNDVRFDNVYITSYFRKIDVRRRIKAKKIILPLKKIESGQYIIGATLKMVKSERKKFGKGTVLLIIRAVCAWMIFFIDKLLYTVLDIIRRHSRVDYKQTGFNHINVTVVGKGFMGNIVRLFIMGLDTKHELNQLTSNVECLPQPVAMDQKYYYYVFGVYIIIWILIVVDAYALRLRRVVAAFFFRKREKQRVLHLYNTMLKRRKMFLRDAVRKLKKRAKKFQLKSKSGVLYSLRKCCPTMCSWLTIFSSAKARCIACNERETKSFKSCTNKTCKFVYCPECWFELKGKCYACLPLADFSSTDADDTTDDDNDADDV